MVNSLRRIALLTIACSFGCSLAIDTSGYTFTHDGGNNAGDGGAPLTILPGCDVDVDPNGDVGTITFDVDTLEVPSTTTIDGIDVDGKTSETADAAGCFQVDGTSPGSAVKNVDNALATFVESTKTAFAIDLARAFRNSISVVSPAPTAALRVLVSRWNQTAVDRCVTIEVFVGNTSNGTFTSVGKSATLLDEGVSPVVPLSGASVDLAVPVESSACSPAAAPPECSAVGATGDCIASLPFSLRELAIRVHLAQNPSIPGGWQLVTNRPLDGVSDVAEPTLFSGYATYWDTSTSRPDCTTTQPTAATLEAGLFATTCHFGTSSSWAGTCNGIASTLDLRDASGSVSGGCTSGTSSATSNANSLSVGLFAGSGYGSMLQGCTTSIDPAGDTGSVTFAIDTLQVPTTIAGVVDGFDVDGVSSTVSNLEGCFATDRKSHESPFTSVDNAFSTLASAFAGTGIFDLPAAYQTAITPPVGQTVTERIRVTISRWNKTSNDRCVNVALEAAGPTGSFIGSLNVATVLVDGVTPTLSSPTSTYFPVTAPVRDPSCSVGAALPAACGAGTVTCTPRLDARLQNVRLRVHVEANAAAPNGWQLVTNRPLDGAAAVDSPTMVGGYVHYWDATTTRPACTTQPLESGTFEQSLLNALCQTGHGNVYSTACSLGSGSLDLFESGSTLASCSVGTSSSTSNASAISAAFYLGSNYHP